MGVFRAYDIRGKYPKEVNKDFAFKLGLAFSEYLKKNKLGKKVVVGRDYRKGSDTMMEEFVKACIETGLSVTTIGICSTPCLFYHTDKFDAGVMVTASHNPKIYNGFKFSLKNGNTISYETGINEIEKIMNSDIKYHKDHGSCKVSNIQRYIEGISKKFKVADFSSLKVVVDSGNGATATSYPYVFKNLKINYIPVFLEMNQNFPNHDPNPTKVENLKKLKELVIKHKADIGVAFDGDGDRVVFLDEEGEMLSASTTAKIIAQEYLKKNAKFVFDLRLSKSLTEFIHSKGGEVVISKVGQVNIKQRMRETKAVLGVEESGHIMHSPINNIDDGMYSALVFMRILKKTGNKLSEIRKSLDKYYMTKLNLEVKDKEKAILKIRSKFLDSKMTFLDGVSLSNSDWWANVRPSNTEDLLRITVEGVSKKIVDAKIKDIKKIL